MNKRYYFSFFVTALSNLELAAVGHRLGRNSKANARDVIKSALRLKWIRRNFDSSRTSAEINVELSDDPRNHTAASVQMPPISKPTIESTTMQSITTNVHLESIEGKVTVEVPSGTEGPTTTRSIIHSTEADITPTTISISTLTPDVIITEPTTLPFVSTTNGRFESFPTEPTSGIATTLSTSITIESIVSDVHIPSIEPSKSDQSNLIDNMTLIDQSVLNQSNHTDTEMSITMTPTYTPTTAPEPMTERMTPIADTYVEFNSSYPFGTKTRLRVDGNPLRVTLIRFDLTPLVLTKAVDLTSAKLRLFSLTDARFGGRVDIVADDICGEWEEDISWETAPPGVFTNVTKPVGSFGSISAFQWNEANLSLRLEYLPLHLTLRVSSFSTNGVTFASRENVTAMPELIVNFFGTPYDDTEMPTYAPTAIHSTLPSIAVSTSPTQTPTKTINPPTRSPLDVLEIKVSKDAMLRNGFYSNRLFGYDPYIAIKSSFNENWEGKAILEFDLSDFQVDVYTYELRLFITYVGLDNSRTVTIYRVSDEFEWGEEWITWNRLGNPELESLASFNILNRYQGSFVHIPLGKLNILDGPLNIIIEITSWPSQGSKVDFISRDNGSSPPALIATPV